MIVMDHDVESYDDNMGYIAFNIGDIIDGQQVDFNTPVSLGLDLLG